MPPTHLASCGDEKDDADDGDTLGPDEGPAEWKELLLKLLYLKAQRFRLETKKKKKTKEVIFFSKYKI